MAKPSDSNDLKNRLRKGELTADDIAYLERLVDQATTMTVGGRPIVARLPGGLDVIK